MNVERLLEDLKRDEGFEARAYRDTAGFLTIGYGRNLDAKPMREIEAAFCLRCDLLDAIADAVAVVKNFGGLTARRQEALVNMALNLGRAGLATFRLMLQAIDRGDYAEAGRQALDSRWARQVGARAERIAQALIDG